MAFHGGEYGHPERLSGLKQAMYVLSRLYDGAPEKSIVESCDKDRQVIEIWIEFLKERNWIIRDSSNTKWELTEDGKNQVTSYFLV